MVEPQIFVSDEMAEMMNQKFNLEDPEKTPDAPSNNATNNATNDEPDGTDLSWDEESSTSKDLNFAFNNDSNNDNDEDKDEDEDEPSTLKTLLTNYGYEDDDDFKELDLKDNSVEAIKKFYEIRDVKKVKEIAAQILEEDEDIKSLSEWKKEGKSVASWKAQKEAEAFTIEISDDDIEGHEKFVRSVYEQQGIKGKKLDAIIEQLKDDDELLTESKDFQEKIKQSVKQNADAIAKQEAVKAKTEQELRDKEIKEVNEIIKTGKLANRLIIPETERTTFNKYLFSKDREEKWNKLDTETQLLIEYMLYKDFNIKGVEKKQVVAASSGNRKPALAGKAGDSKDIPEMSFEELKRKLGNKQA